MLLSLVTAVATFLLCAWIARILTRPIAHMHWLLQDMHDAFAFTDPHVIVAFVVGLACSAALLYRFGAFQTPPALHQNEWRAFKLIERTRVSHSSSVYRFAIPHQLGLPIGQHVSIRASIDGKPMVRSYTPISDHTATGHVDFLVKTYEKGNVSRAFDEASGIDDPVIWTDKRDQEMWAALDKQIAEDVPSVPLLNRRNSFLHGSGVAGFFVESYPAYPSYQVIGVSAS